MNISYITIGTGDEVHKDKLRLLKYVYGRFIIQNTNLTDLTFLGNLEYVSQLNDSSIPFQINGNKQLQNVTLPSLKRVFAKTTYQISFQDNSDSLLNSAACMNLMNDLFDTNVSFSGKECEVIDRANENKNSPGIGIDPACWFREDNINSSTIYKWPVNCTDVCGMMNFYEDSDLTVFELQQYFQNLKVLKGGLTMYNTKYASLEFLETLEEVYCDELNVFDLAFNPNLEVLNFGDLRNITCNFYAYNNTVLNATSFCNKYADLTVMFIYDNFKSCEGCIVRTLYSSDLQKYAECKSMINAMWFSYFYTDYDPPIDLSPLANIQNLTGCLAFYNTDLKNMSFFESLENMKSNRYLNNDLSIEMCYNMTRLGFPALKTISTARDFFYVNVDKPHPDFCFTTSEMRFFLENKVKFNKLDAKFCFDDIGEGVCIFDKLSSLGSNCTEILGNITIGTGDEVHKDKLRLLKYVYGRFIIQNTNLTDLSFLGNLEYVSQLNDSSIPFQINENKQLQNVTLPSLKRVFAKTKYQIIFQDNSDSLLNSAACMNLMNDLFDTNVSFNGKECEVIDREQEAVKNSQRIVMGTWQLLLVLPFLFL